VVSAVAADSETGEHRYVLVEHEGVARSTVAEEDVLDEVYGNIDIISTYHF